MAIYQRVLSVAYEYLGNQAQEFLERQCRYHVGVELHELALEDLDSLGWWCYVSASLIIGNQKALKFQQQVVNMKALVPASVSG